MKPPSGGSGRSGSLDLASHPEVGEVWRKMSELRSSVQAEESGVVSCLTRLSRQRGDQERAMTDTVSKLQEIIAMRKTELLENLSTCFNDEVRDCAMEWCCYDMLLRQSLCCHYELWSCLCSCVLWCGGGIVLA